MKSLTLLVIIGALVACQGAEIVDRLNGKLKDKANRKEGIKFLYLFTLFSPAANQRSVSSIITDGLEALKVQMVDGWPQYGIPSLVPLEISHKDFNIGSEELFANGFIDSCEVHGLNGFDIIKMEVNMIRSRITYEFNFGSLNVTTQYKADVGAGYHIERDGGAFLALENLRVYGVIKYSTGIVTGNLQIKEINVNFEVGNVVSQIENLSKYRIMNRKLNEIVEEFINITINENTELVADWINDAATPVVNDLIGDRSLQDLINLIVGGGSS